MSSGTAITANNAVMPCEAKTSQTNKPTLQALAKCEGYFFMNYFQNGNNHLGFIAKLSPSYRQVIAKFIPNHGLLP
jgi:hypothetical protein